MAQINSVQAKPKRDIVDTVLAGLNIAKGVYDIKTDMAKLDNYDIEQQQAQIRQRRDQEGYVTGKELAEIARTHTLSREPLDDPNAVKLKDQQGDIYASVMPAKVSTREVRLRQPDGSELVSIVPDTVTDKPYVSFAAPDREKQQIVEVYDPETKSVVKKWVSPDPSVVYPQAPKEDSPFLLNAKQNAFNDHLLKFNDKTAPLNKTFTALSQVEDKLGFKLKDFNDDGTITKADPASGAIVKVAPDLPGISIPVAGRVTFFSEKARDLYSTIQKVFNVELKDRSGAAVSNREMENLKTEFEQGKYNTESEMVGALKRYQEAAAQELAHQENGFKHIKNIDGKSVVDVIGEGGGFTSQTIGQKDQAQAISPAAAELLQRGWKPDGKGGWTK